LSQQDTISDCFFNPVLNYNSDCLYKFTNTRGTAKKKKTKLARHRITYSEAMMPNKCYSGHCKAADEKVVVLSVGHRTCDL